MTQNPKMVRRSDFNQGYGLVELLVGTAISIITFAAALTVTNYIYSCYISFERRLIYRNTLAGIAYNITNPEAWKHTLAAPDNEILRCFTDNRFPVDKSPSCQKHSPYIEIRDSWNRSTLTTYQNEHTGFTNLGRLCFTFGLRKASSECSYRITASVTLTCHNCDEPQIMVTLKTTLSEHSQEVNNLFRFTGERIIYKNLVRIPPPTHLVSAERETYCVLYPDHRAKCWGRNTSRNIGGMGGRSWSDHAVDAIDYRPFVNVGLGSSHGCGIDPDGKTYCWGNASGGNLGNGVGMGDFPLPQLIMTDPATTVTASGSGHCASMADGTARCWGSNLGGRLGRPTPAFSLVPLDVPGVNTARSIHGSRGTRGVILDDGTALCWGENFDGQCGIGTTANLYSPTPIPGLTSLVSLAFNYWHSCAADDSGQVYCWGRNMHGELGLGHYGPPVLTPQLVTLPEKAIKIATGVDRSNGSGHSCAVLLSGSVHCWGTNRHGQLGRGTTTTRETTPMPVVGLGGRATDLKCAFLSCCALLEDGRVQCWGDGLGGKLGHDKGTMDSSVPLTVVGLK